MSARFSYGENVRVVRPLRNDGTYPGMDRGSLLIPRGSTGLVKDVGRFLQDQIIYSVHFIEQGRIVGCREEELIGAGEPWVETRFEFRDKVRARIALGIGGDIVAAPGDGGEVWKVIRDPATSPAYHVLFNGRMLQVPEHALEPAGECLP